MRRSSKSVTSELTPAAASAFVRVKEKLTDHLDKKTGFLLYGEGGLGQEAVALLTEAGIMIVDVEKLASFEMPSKRT